MTRHISIRLRHFYLQHYIYIYILNILFRLKTLFTRKSKNFLLIIAIVLSVIIRPDKHLQGFECPVKL